MISVDAVKQFLDSLRLHDRAVVMDSLAELFDVNGPTAVIINDLECPAMVKC